MNSGKYFDVRQIEANPFKTSKNKVKAASIFFPVLRTFVAPMLPEPTFLISFFKKNLVISNPKGIEPSM